MVLHRHKEAVPWAERVVHFGEWLGLRPALYFAKAHAALAPSVSRWWIGQISELDGAQSAQHPPRANAGRAAPSG